jgi:hypothetical protein
VYDKVEREYKITFIGDAEELDEAEERLRDLLSELKDDNNVKATFETVSETPIDDEDETSEMDEDESEEEDDA